MQDRTLVSVLRFDTESEQLIREATSAIQRALGRTSSEDIGPHISLIPTDTRDEAGLSTRLGLVANETQALVIRFAHLGWFPGGVLFLGATPAAELIDLHQRIHEISDAGPDTLWLDLYGPGSWVPHCTLAIGVPDDKVSDVLAEAARLVALPLDVRCTAVDLVALSKTTVESIRTFTLAGDSG